MTRLGIRPRQVATGALLLSLLLTGGAAPADANTAARKLGRGLAAVTCGFLEIPGNVVKTHREQGPAYGFTLGVAKGLGAMVVRELVGVYEVLSAPIEAPQGFRPILKPEFPWDYFD